jgi:predicted enzyme related to lactoylglutathione lyase
MPHIDQHAPGSFAWIELATTDQNAAKSFYAELFGWGFRDDPIGPTDFYTMFQVEGRNAAAAYTMSVKETLGGMPPHWNIYISVTSADETTAKATTLGGAVLAGPFDVMNHGRMSVLQDPTGAAFCIWEPKDHPGLGIAGQANTLCWADLSTPDQQKAIDFYSGLFGYKISGSTVGDSGYLHIENGSEMIGGIQDPAFRAQNRPPFWLIYIAVDDCGAMTEKAKSLGATVYMGPEAMENVGTLTVLADPQGAVFALFQSAPRG